MEQVNKDKEQIIAHYEKSISRVNNLVELSEKQWRTPIDKDKWTIAEVIGHLTPWDEFVLHQRIPYLFTGVELPKSPDANEINNQASKDSQRQSKKEIIDKFIDSRQSLLKVVKNLANELWLEDFTIGNSKLTLFTYFKGLTEHDEHHFMQIEKALRLL